jgi:hypothetical protein
MTSPFSARRAAIAVFALVAMLGTALLVPSSAASAAPAPAAAPSAAAAPAPSGAPVAVTSEGRVDAPRNLRAGCRMPRCFGSIAFNVKTGFWAKTKNYGSKRRAKRKAMRLCKSADHRDRHCTSMGWVRGRYCLGAAKKVKGGEIRKARSALAKRPKRAIRKAKRKLGGQPKYRKKITVTCNG